MKPKLVKPVNVIKQKAGDGGFRADDIAKAQTMIETTEIDFRPVGLGFCAELDDILSRIAAGDIGPGSYFNEIMYPVMQLKAQGGMFQYASISHISQLIIDFLERGSAIDGPALDVVAAYIQTVRAILRLELRAVGEPENQALYQALAGACSRHAKAAARAAAAAKDASSGV